MNMDGHSQLQITDFIQIVSVGLFCWKVELCVSHSCGFGCNITGAKAGLFDGSRLH